ncbi:MAG: hypothetical protein ACKVOQ_05200 [Cyclobacteriaceae bacterium]
MKKLTTLVSCLICLLCANNVLAQAPAKSKGPQVIVKKEFCPQEEMADEGAADAAPKIVDETQIGKIFKAFEYKSIYKKLNNDYTVTKWRIKNQYTEKQIDTIVVISAGRQSDRLVYYAINKFAGVSVPGIMSAKFTRVFFDIAGIKIGMTRKAIEKLVPSTKSGMESNPVIITNEPQNTFLSLYYTSNVLSGMSFSSYTE